MARRPPTNPIGEPGPPPISADGNFSWQRIQFPERKADVERLVVEVFLNEVRSVFPIETAVPNAENDFDFSLETPRGTIQLELAEIVVPGAGSTPFESRRSV